MALLGGGPRVRSKKTVKQIIREIRTKQRGGIQEFGLPIPKGAIKPLVRAGGSLLRRLGRKIPLVKKIVPGSPERIAKAERLAGVRGLSGVTRSPGKFRPVARGSTRGGFVAAKPIAVAATKLVVAGAALEGGSRALQAILPSPVVTLGGGQQAGGPGIFGGGRTLAHPSIGSGGGGGGLQLGGQAPPGNTIVKVWDTGTARFARDASGMHYVLKKDGTIKRFRPPRPVCIPKKWDSRSMSRVMRRLGSHQKAAIKLVQMMGGSASKTKHHHRG